MSQDNSTFWLDRVLVRLPASSGGGTIVGNIGSAGHSAAIGQNIVQVTDMLGKPQPGDEAEVARAIQQLRAEFDRVAPQLSEGQRYVAADKIDTIEQQLRKKDGPPSGDLIRAAGDWLVDNIPALGSAVLSTFIPEPVGRIVLTAGTATIEWLKLLRDRIAS